MRPDDPEQELELLREASQRIADNLLELEADQTKDLLEKSNLQGATATSWAQANASLSELWRQRGLLELTSSNRADRAPPPQGRAPRAPQRPARSSSQATTCRSPSAGCSRARSGPSAAHPRNCSKACRAPSTASRRRSHRSAPPGTRCSPRWSARADSPPHCNSLATDLGESRPPRPRRRAQRARPPERCGQRRPAVGERQGDRSTSSLARGNPRRARGRPNAQAGLRRAD